MLTSWYLSYKFCGLGYCYDSQHKPALWCTAGTCQFYFCFIMIAFVSLFQQKFLEKHWKSWEKTTLLPFFLFVSSTWFCFLLLSESLQQQFFTLSWHFISVAAVDFSLHFSQHFQNQPHHASSEGSASPSRLLLRQLSTDTSVSALWIFYAISELLISNFNCPSLSRKSVLSS